MLACPQLPKADFPASSASPPLYLSTAIDKLHGSQYPVSNLIQTVSAPFLDPQGNCRGWVTEAQGFIILYSLLLHIVGYFHNEKFFKKQSSEGWPKCANSKASRPLPD